MRERFEYDIDELTFNNTNNFDIFVDGVVVASSDDVKNVLATKYFSFLFLSTKNKVVEAMADFNNAWHLFVTSRKADFLKMYNALNTNYNPLENYNRVESTTNATNGGYTNNGTNSTNATMTSTGDYTNNGTNGGTITNVITPTQKQRTSTFENAYDQTTASLVSYVDSETVEGNTTNLTTNALTNSLTNEHSDSSENSQSSTSTDTNTHNDTTTITSNISGNIGVTTSQQMLESELQLRRYNLLNEIVKMFVFEYCYL